MSWWFKLFDELVVIRSVGGYSMSWWLSDELVVIGLVGGYRMSSWLLDGLVVIGWVVGYRIGSWVSVSSLLLPPPLLLPFPPLFSLLLKPHENRDLHHGDNGTHQMVHIKQKTDYGVTTCPPGSFWGSVEPVWRPKGDE